MIVSGDYDRAAKLMRTASAPKEHGTGVTGSEIDATAHRLGVSLIGSYRRFLGDFGWADFGRWSIFGLGATVPRGLNVELRTISERTEMYPRMPSWLVPFYNDGMGSHLCLDPKRFGEPGEYAVVFWDHDLDEDQSIHVKHASFEQWLYRELMETT
jgi:hypothetical protein